MGEGKEKHTCLHFLVVLIQIFDTILSCPASMPTISYVSYCPTNQEEWEKAAEQKNCESIAVIQNCTDRNKFQYHCLMNHWKNATLEVCAPIFFLQGYCAEYNIQMKQVAEIYDEGFECLKFNGTSKCPRRYPSSEAYKYQRCYRYKNISMITEKLSSKNKDNSWIALVFIVIASLLFGILAFVVVMMRKGKCDKLSKDDTEEGQNLLHVQRSEMPKENISEDDNFSPGCQQPNEESEQNRFESLTKANEDKENLKREIDEQTDTKETLKEIQKFTDTHAKTEEELQKRLVEVNKGNDIFKKQIEEQCGEKQKVKTKVAPPPPTDLPRKDEKDGTVSGQIKSIKTKPAPLRPSQTD